MEKVSTRKYVMIAILLTILIHILISLIFYLKYPESNLFFFESLNDIQENIPQDINVFYDEPQQPPQQNSANSIPYSNQEDYYNIANKEIGENPEMTARPQDFYVPEVSAKKSSPKKPETIQEEPIDDLQEKTEEEENVIKLAKVFSDYSLNEAAAEQENIPNKPTPKKIKENLLTGAQLLRGFQQFQYDQYVENQDEYGDENSQDQNQDQNNEEQHRTITAKINNEFKDALNFRSLSVPVSLESKTDREEIYVDRDIRKVISVDIVFGPGGKVLDVIFIESTGIKAADEKLKKWIFAVSPIQRYAKYYKGKPFRINLPIMANIPKGKMAVEFRG
ncbi:hypothetical protein M1446_01900 [Candidatus Dependentiae bacterium]|nr:hypothetical protein [Candidatus Dependentiae bacterium]